MWQRERLDPASEPGQTTVLYMDSMAWGSHCPIASLGASSFTGWRCWLLVSVRPHAAVKWYHPSALPFPSCYCCLVTKSCPTLCNPMDYSPPGSSVHGISQARILEWVAVSFSRGSSFLVLLYHYIDPRLRCQTHFMIWLWEVLLSLVKQTNPPKILSKTFR